MLKNIKSVSVDPSDWTFASAMQSETIYDETFTLMKDLLVNFDHSTQGKVALSAVSPEVSAPHYSIKPINMGAAQWYSIECQVSKEDLDGVGQLIACLDASSPQSASLFALVRIHYDNGRSEDISSLQVELRRNRSLQTFPISLEDLPHRSRSSISSAQLIFFIEARDVAIDIYGFSLISAPTAETSYSLDSISRLRRAYDTGVPYLQMAGIGVDDENAWTGETSEHRQLSRNVFLDFEPGAGRQVSVHKNNDELEIDFSATSDSGWRSLEFRFEGVINSGSILGLINLNLATASKKLTELNVILRQYDENFGWEDTAIPTRPFQISGGDSESLIIDLSPILSDKRSIHNFGIMLFLHSKVERLNINELSAFVFDREIV